MCPLISDSDLERVPLSTPGEYVDLKRQPSHRDRTLLRAAAIRLSIQFTGDQTADVDQDGAIVEAIEFLGLDLAIKAWSLPEPLTPENIRQLPDADYEILASRLKELWQPRSEGDSKNVSGNGRITNSAKARRRVS